MVFILLWIVRTITTLIWENIIILSHSFTALVQTKETGKLILPVSKKYSDKGFFLRFNSISSAADAIANNLMYHNLCCEDAKKKANPKSEQSVN